MTATPAPVRFDNRLNPGAYRRLMRYQCGLHLAFEVAGKRIVYCYIRKNACTTFKDFIVATSPKRDLAPVGEDPMGFLRAHHKARFPRDLWAADHVIFVHRDPVERAVSLFKNKFIQQAGAVDIRTDYLAVTGRNPSTASFTDFVRDYLSPDFAARDGHTRPQSHHLFPAVYTDAITIADLHGAMSGIVGPALADAHFRRPVNESAAAVAGGPVADVAAEVLRAGWKAGQGMPETAAFLTPELQERLEDLYRADRALAVK